MRLEMALRQLSQYCANVSAHRFHLLKVLFSAEMPVSAASALGVQALDAGRGMSLVRNQAVWEARDGSTTRFIVREAVAMRGGVRRRLNTASHAGSDTNEGFAAAWTGNLTTTPNEKCAIPPG